MEHGLDLANPAILSFIQENQYRYVAYEDFLVGPIPYGMTHEEAWDLLSFVRCIQGRPRVDIESASAEDLVQRSFWVATPAMIETFARLAQICAVSAPLVQDLKKPLSREPLQDLLAEEVWAAAMRDGLQIERETIGMLVRSEKSSLSDPTECLIVNCLQVLSDIALSASEELLMPLTTEKLTSLYVALCGDVASLPVQPLKTFANGMPHVEQDQTVWLEDIVENIGLSYPWGPHIFFGMVMNSDVLWESRPFDRCNGLMGLILWHYVCFYFHVPALRFVPLSKMRLDWELELISMGSSIFKHGQAIVLSRYGLDCTPYLQVITGLLERGVDRLQAIARKACEADEARKEAIAADGRLSLRQKSFLQALVDEPDQAFALADYRRCFDIALSTARADVEGLVSMRWLDDEFEGKRRVYRLRSR